ncbi:MAG: addiction module protein [Deltaproteobacteria bacterium HGW-Deltaproteobacteria-21]|nr:MAG: addiction module protein [Deltaproteobacteria bacterium HGW-Deltaproteobacteria-21]
MSTFTEKDILELSVPERIQLAQDIWDSVAKVPESLALSEEEKAEIDRRLDAYHQDPNAGSPWSVVRDRIRSRA